MMSSSITSTTFPTNTLSHLNDDATLHHHHHHRLGVSINFPSIKRRRFVAHASSVLHLPLLPFPLDQVFVPCEAKTLHLYEARYLMLLDESLIKKRRQFVHFVLDPIALSETAAEVSFAARYGCLVMIEKVERLDVGALVSIRGIGRVRIVQFEQVKYEFVADEHARRKTFQKRKSGLLKKAQPFLRGAVVPLQDNVLRSATEISFKVAELKEALQSLNGLEMKLKAPKEALLQTQVANCLTWAEKVPDGECDKAFIPALPERISFAAMQPITGSSQLELLKLQKEKLRAMDVKDTVERLERSIEFSRNNISMVAAKLAIQSLDVQ